MCRQLRELSALLMAGSGAFTPEPHDTAGLIGDDALRAGASLAVGHCDHGPAGP